MEIEIDEGDLRQKDFDPWSVYRTRAIRQWLEKQLERIDA